MKRVGIHPNPFFIYGMKLIIKNAITEEEEFLLPEFFQKLINNTNPIVDKLLLIIKKNVDFVLCNESYSVLEKTPESGHVWHKDTGTNNKMPWCKFGVSILLKGEHSGGELLYRDSDGKVFEQPGRKVYDMYIHTSDEEHKINRVVGNRRVFLMFI